MPLAGPAVLEIDALTGHTVLTTRSGSHLAACRVFACHALVVTSTMSLFACSPADVTLERVRELVGQDLPESLTLKYPDPEI